MEPDSAGARVRAALDLFEVAESLVRQRLRRERPEAASDEIEQMVEAQRGGSPRRRGSRLGGTAKASASVNAAEQRLRRAVADLNACGVRWALVGGFAVSAWVEPRLTRDVDAAVAVADDGAAEELVRRLSAMGSRARVSNRR